MDPEFPRLTTPKKHILYEAGGGSLQTWYEAGVESEGSKRIKYGTTDHFSGPLPLFPKLDVMAGEASAENDGILYTWGLSTAPMKNIDVAVLNFEEELGGLHGYRVHNNTGFEEESINQSKHGEIDSLFMLSGSNIDSHSAQGPHGMHVIDSQIAELSGQVASQHNMGDAQEARDAGLERGDNPAINAQETGKGEVYENVDTVDTSEPAAIPMDIDAIEIDGVITKPHDTNVVLGGNQST